MNQFIGQQLGNYKLVKLLGKGGFGEVYMAQHVYLTDYAAVKVITGGITQNFIQEFLNEARTLSQIKHPNVIRVIDFGVVDEKIPYLVMEFAPGGTAPSKCVIGFQDIESYLTQISAGLQAAHDLRIIHRDIKPMNILIGSDGKIKVSDFGIAATAHSTNSLNTSEFAGTAYYSAPEQITGKPQVNSDQYSLAIMVYEWLTGKVPFTGTFQEIIMQHIGAPVPQMSGNDITVPSSVEEVVMKALSKDPKERYISVIEFAKAFSQAVHGTPLQSRTTYKKAHITEQTVYPTQLQPTQIATPKAKSIVNTKKKLSFVALVVLILFTVIAITIPSVVLISRNNSLKILPQMGTKIERTSSNSNSGSFQGNTQGKNVLTYTEHTGPVWHIAWSPDGKYIVSSSKDGTAQVWDSKTGNLVTKYTGHSAPVSWVAWSPDGKHIASGGSDNTVQVWNAFTGQLTTRYTGHTAPVVCLAWSPDGKNIASGGADHTIQVWNAFSGQLVTRYGGHSDNVNGISWSPDGNYIASASNDKTAQVWDAFTGKLIMMYVGHSDFLNTIAWSPDGKDIASGGKDGTVQIWDSTSGKLVTRYSAHSGDVWSAVWSPNGKDIASGGIDTTVKIWDALSGRTIFNYSGHSGYIHSIAWSFDSKYIASGSEDGLVKIWSSGI